MVGVQSCSLKGLTYNFLASKKGYTSKCLEKVTLLAVKYSLQQLIMSVLGRVVGAPFHALIYHFHLLLVAISAVYCAYMI